MKQDDSAPLPSSFDLLYDIKTYGQLRQELKLAENRLKSMQETIADHNIKL